VSACKSRLLVMRRCRPAVQAARQLSGLDGFIYSIP
jgi:hypothetical protein